MLVGALLLAIPGPAALWAGNWEELVAEGERWWSRGPDPGQPVACATCHHDPDATRGWAASFPKFRPLPPPHARVMTLLQANAEAVERHYRLEDPRLVATAITAFVTARAVGLPVSPGIAPDQPVFPARLRALAASVERGRRLYGRQCRGCHDAGAVAPATGGFRTTVAEPVEVFLEGHRPLGPRIAWNSRGMADLLAFLRAHRAGEPVTAGSMSHILEVSR
jgi:mono/diheme cytochrome c family protein